MEETMRRIERWYAHHCNGSWEHQYGLRIDTIDNPGWKVLVDLDETELRRRDFTELSVDRSEQNWIRCRVSCEKFEGYGGVENLKEILDVFLAWANL